MWNMLWPLLLIVASNTFYHICAKSVPEEAHAFVVSVYLALLIYLDDRRAAFEQGSHNLAELVQQTSDERIDGGIIGKGLGLRGVGSGCIALGAAAQLHLNQHLQEVLADGRGYLFLLNKVQVGQHLLEPCLVQDAVLHLVPYGVGEGAKAAVKDFNFGKGILVALLACFSKKSKMV